MVCAVVCSWDAQQKTGTHHPDRVGDCDDWTGSPATASAIAVVIFAPGRLVLVRSDTAQRGPLGAPGQAGTAHRPIPRDSNPTWSRDIAAVTVRTACPRTKSRNYYRWGPVVTRSGWVDCGKRLEDFEVEDAAKLGWNVKVHGKVRQAAFVPVTGEMEVDEAQIVGRGKVVPGLVQATSNYECAYDGIVFR